MQNKRLLYVEDDQQLAEVTIRAFEKRGFDVTHFSMIDGAKASILTSVYNYALLDLKVGQDNSLQLIEHLNTANPHVKIVLLTGYASIATAVSAIKAGATDYLTKPASVRQIINAFESGEASAAITKKEPELESSTDDGFSLKRLEWENIQRVLAENNGNISATARQLKMHRRTLQRKLEKRPTKH